MVDFAVPRSLWEMNAGGGDPSWADALAQNRASLVGLGLGLASGGFAGAMEGYGQGSRTDAATMARRAQMKQHEQDLAFRQAEAKRQAGQWQQSFNRGNVTDFQKAARDLGLTPGTPEYLAAAKQFYQPKTEGDWSVVQAPHPHYPGETVPMWGNKRTQEVRPFTAPGGAAPTDAVAGLPPIPAAPPGSDPKEWRKEQTKLAVQQRAAAEARAKQAGSIDPVTEDIDRAINQTTAYPGMVTGAFGKLMTNVPGSQARDVSNLVDTIKANASLDKLQQMRAASPSGASGLGAVTQGEHKLLQDAIGALDQSQTSDQFLYNLDRVKRIRHEVVHGPGTAPPPQFELPKEQRAPRATGGDAPRPGYQKGGYVFKGGDPSKQENWAPVGGR